MIEIKEQIPSGGCSSCGAYEEADDYTYSERKKNLINTDTGWLCKECYGALEGVNGSK